jgi:hypothetical protein
MLRNRSSCLLLVLLGAHATIVKEEKRRYHGANAMGHGSKIAPERNHRLPAVPGFF